MKPTRHRRLPAAAVLAAAFAATLCLGLAGCETDSTNTSSVVSNNSGTVYDFSALYTANTANAEGDGFLVYPTDRQSGTKLTWMRIIQSGSSLQGYDNAGENWTGAISGVEDTTHYFNFFFLLKNVSNFIFLSLGKKFFCSFADYIQIYLK